MSLYPWDERHGTYYAYASLRCRCDECREAAARYKRRAREDRQGLPAGDPRHGTYNAYTNWFCRCDECREAGARANASRKVAR